MLCQNMLLRRHQTEFKLSDPAMKDKFLPHRQILPLHVKMSSLTVVSFPIRLPHGAVHRQILVRV